MANNNYDLQLDKFNSRLKFYFSLMFMSKTDFLALESYFGKNIDVFNFNEEKFEEKDIELLSNILENVKWNNNQINLTDNVISRLFVEDELIEYYNDYILKNETFNLEDPEKLEDFLCFSMLNKIREKKNINIGTIYDFFEPATKQEIHKAISNLNGYDHEQFTMYFGINYDKEVKINTNDKVKNDLLIKLYSYILNNREENDIPILLTMVSKDLVKDYDLYDYIRRLCGDDTISNDSIAKIISKLDYDTKLNIKLTYGKDYKEKKKAPDNQTFKKAIINVVKAVKEENKKKKNVKATTIKRKSKGINEEEKNKKKQNEKAKSKEKNKEKIKKEEPNTKKDSKKKEKTEEKKEKKNKDKPKEDKKETKKDPEKEIKEEKKQEKKTKKEENKKARLDKFLAEYNLDKKDFLIAVSMLGLVSKTIVELYFGLKKEDPIDIEEIAVKLSRSVDIILDLLDEATKKIVDLVKSGKINEKKTVIPVSKGFVEENKLSSFVTEKNPKKENLAKAVGILLPLHASIVGDHLGINGRAKSVSELAKDYNYSEKTINNILNASTNPVINELSILEKEDEKKKVKPVVEEDKKIVEHKEETVVKEKKKVENEKEVKKEKLDTKKIKAATTLNEFLKASGLTKDEFNYGYKSLDSMSKRIISLYFSSYTLDEIAKECNLSKEAVESRIDAIKNEIISKAIELRKAQGNMTLRSFLKQNDISLTDFNKYFRSLTPIKQTVLSLYLGLNTKALSPKQIADKLYRSEASINEMIRTAATDLKEMSKKTEKKAVGRLQQFLKQNNITMEQFNFALNSLSKVNRTVISLYFGLNGFEKQIGDIASVTGLSRLEVINIISSCKSDIVSLAKENNKKDKFNPNLELEKKAKDVIIQMKDNPELALLIRNSNPIGFQALGMLANYNISISELSSILKIPEGAVINSLMGAIATANNYTNSNNMDKSSAFHDNDGTLKRERDRSR